MSLILADIGGTYARFAVSEQCDPSLRHITYLRCSDFEGFEDAFERFLAGLPRDEQSGHHLLSLAVAGPVNDQIVDVSNNHQENIKGYLVTIELIYLRWIPSSLHLLFGRVWGELVGWVMWLPLFPKQSLAVGVFTVLLKGP